MRWIVRARVCDSLQVWGWLFQSGVEFNSAKVFVEITVVSCGNNAGV